MIDLSLKNANILIVDDQEANLDVLEGLLEMQGYLHIKTTQDPRNVVTLFSEFNPDLILLDLQMPYLTGFEVMDRLKLLVPGNTHLPILVLTADITTETKQKALSGGASDFLTKPFDLIEVGLRIKNLLYASYLQQQLKNQNQILEEKVKERTFELEKKNKELHEAKERAEEGDRLKTSFINNISHEIRTPLNGILGFGQLMANEKLDDEEKLQYLAMLNESVDRLVNTVTNFMDISLLKSKNLKLNLNVFEPVEVIEEVVYKFQEICNSKNIDISVQIKSSDEVERIYTDRELLIKIFHQLVDNAVKFTQKGSIKVGFEKISSKIKFFVEDTGIGISEGSHKLIFKDFNQENNSNTRGYEGSGLGLSIAQGITGLLGSVIELKSEKGKGSVFYFELPVYGDAQIKNEKQEFRKLKNKGEQQTILIAEDNEFNFYFFELILKNEFTTILHAWNGIEAVELCKNHNEIDLVLMDLKMPVMNGFEATEKIKQFRKNLPVIAVSAYSSVEDKQLASQCGSDDFISKPVKIDLLINKIVEFGLIDYSGNKAE